MMKTSSNHAELLFTVKLNFLVLVIGSSRTVVKRRGRLVSLKFLLGRKHSRYHVRHPEGSAWL